MANEHWMVYPPTEDYRTGCKVGWRKYPTEVEANACARAARNNAIIQASNGYDFGYCSPGSIELKPDGKYEVCIP